MKTINLHTLIRLAHVAVALALVVGFFPSNTLAAGEGDMVEINSVPRVFSQTAIEQNLRENRGIPWFNGTGYIDQVVENGFIVDDKALTGFNVDLRSEASGQPLPSSNFKPGVKVGYVLNSKNALVSLWLLKEQ
ncbi:MAG: hypothetical protein JEZ02_10520 [Desulfatibacillum sp.]|nr:hypothetical protein [Desulfatibacillum sp.]